MGTYITRGIALEVSFPGLYIVSSGKVVALVAADPFGWSTRALMPPHDLGCFTVPPCRSLRPSLNRNQI